MSMDVFQALYIIIGAICSGGFLISVARNDGIKAVNFYTVIGSCFLAMTWPIWMSVLMWIHLLMWWEIRSKR